MSAPLNRVEVDAVDFQISCRRFTIRATITRDRQLPVVDEFVLRLLAILERMSITRMRSWFGFSKGEIDAVLIDIRRKGLVEFDGDDVILAPAGRDLFRGGKDEDVPNIVEVAPLISDVWFDLVSRNMIPRSRTRNVDYLLRMREDESARAFPETYARAAFHDNFRDYVKRIRRFPDPDNINLYSISDVEGGSYGYQVLPAKVVLDMDRRSVRPIFADMADAGLSFQRLTVAANDAWLNAFAPEPASSAAAEFERLTGHDWLSALAKEPSDMSHWAKALAGSTSEDAHFRSTVGAIYLSSNLSKILDVITKSGNAASKITLKWLRPSGFAWGRTLRISETLNEIREALKGAGRPELDTLIAMPRSTHQTMRSKHKRLFSRGVLLPSGRLPSNLEILLIPDVVAVVNLHLQLGAHAVPLGGIVTDPKRLSLIGQRLNESDGWEEMWSQARSPDDSVPDPDEVV